MDNFHFDITSNKNLAEALTIAFSNYGHATHWHVKNNTLMFAWTKPSDASWHPFPSKVDAHAAETVINSWLESEADYGREPDHDGDNGKCWRVFCEDWGQVDSSWEAFLGVQPRWAMYGK